MYKMFPVFSMEGVSLYSCWSGWGKVLGYDD